jgi:hypothetical protein
MGRNRRSRLALAATVLVAVAGCSSDADQPGAADPPTRSSPAVASPPPTGAASTTTTTPAVTVTDPKTPDDFRKLAAELLRLRSHAFAVASMEELNRAIAQGCPCYASEAGAVRELAEQHLHYRGPQFEVLGVHAEQVDLPRAVLTVVIGNDRPNPILDAAGSILSTAPTVTRSGLSVALSRGPDDLWRIGAIDQLRLDPIVQQDIVEEGMPR